jgi:hypothetical protein
MKRALALLVGGVLILGSALAANAQAPTVSFNGQMRVYGFTYNNIFDFKDSNNGNFRDNESFYFQRFRLWTNIESADKKAKAVWALEIGDITWGRGGGASGTNFGSCPGATAGLSGVTAGGSSRVGNGAGGCFGNDGINVETKSLYLWMDTNGWAPGTSLTIGIQNIVFMTGPLGGFMDDDAAAIKINWKGDPVDVEVYTAKLGEGNLNSADDVDMYVARVGVNVTKDLRLTLEGMVINDQSLSKVDFGDDFWVGATVGTKLGGINLDGAFVYGERKFAGAVAGTGPFKEKGYGAFVSARAPVGPVNLFAVGWYTSGDSIVGPGSCPSTGPGNNSTCGAASRTLTKDSDKLPLPDAAASWFGGGGPYIAEWLFGNSSIGAPGPSRGQLQYADPTGTYGIGASVSYNVTPAFNVGGGVAYVGATDAGGPYGDNLVEIDAGANYKFNANLLLQLFGGYLIPDKGDSAWALAWRTVYNF